jgi:hypothetical protein
LKAKHPFVPGSGFRHIIIKGERQVVKIKGERQVVKSIVLGLTPTGEFAPEVDKLRILPTFCFAQAGKVKKQREKIGFFRAV